MRASAIPGFVMELDELPGHLDGARQLELFQLLIDEWFEELEGHLFGQTALMQSQIGSDGDDGSSGIIHPLSQKVLAEPALLSLERVAERFQRPLVGPGNHPAVAAVVKENIHGLLQHSFFIAHNNLGRLQVDQPLQAVVAVNHPAIEIV